MSELKFHSEFFNDYMAMVEDTESPRIFHLWAAIGAVSSALGRRCYFPFGHSQIYPNQYVVFVGTPGTRKSTAMDIAKMRLKASTQVSFAPNDTAGNRQGLIKVMLRNSSQSPLFLEGVELGAKDTTLDSISLADFASITDTPEGIDIEVHTADQQHLVALADEFSTFIGQNNATMLDFLTSVWGGVEYVYETASKEITLKKPLLNLLACTTPTSIHLALPAQAGGQGFLSRVILVYGNNKYKMVPSPLPFDLELVSRVEDRLQRIYLECEGPFEQTPEAKAAYEEMYKRPLGITDSRFGYYGERRHTHLIKLAMVCAAARGSMLIQVEDFEEADRILRATEIGMPDALGEFGMNPLAAIKQSVMEYMRQSLAMPLEELRAHFSRDATASQFTEIINDLVRSHQLVLHANNNTMYVSAKSSRRNVVDSMMELLAQRKAELP